jgi:L-rhamnose-H+ transport protein
MIVEGLAITVAAGVLGGSVLAPIKLMRSWTFEKSWAVYSVWAYLAFPWLLALFTVPHLLSIYFQVSSRTMLICAACGLGWGMAVALFGIAVNLVGLSLATAVIYGISIAVGSLSPLLISHPERLFSRQGLWIVLADAGIIAGVLLCAWAGKLRDALKNSMKEASLSKAGHTQFVRGVLAAVAAAFLSSLFNIALAYGGEFNRLAVANGASPLNAANAQWAFTVTFGYLPNVMLTIVTFTRRKQWGSFLTGPPSYWVLAPVMALMFISGTALYGTGAGLMGDIGPVIGWPVYMSISIVAGVFWGWATGEWAGAPRRVLQFLASGTVLQLVSIMVLGARGQ